MRILMVILLLVGRVSLGDNSESLLKDLNSSQPEVRERAVSLLGELGSQYAPRLVSMLKDSHYSVKYAAELALSGMGKGAVGPLASALRGDHELAIKACYLLGRLGTDANGACDDLRQFYKRSLGTSQEIRVWIEVGEALRAIGSIEATAALAALERDKEEFRNRRLSSVDSARLRAYREELERIKLIGEIKRAKAESTCICSAWCRFYQGIAIEIARKYDFKLGPFEASSRSECRAQLGQACMGHTGVGTGDWGDHLRLESYSLGCR